MTYPKLYELGLQMAISKFELQTVSSLYARVNISYVLNSMTILKIYNMNNALASLTYNIITNIIV